MNEQVSTECSLCVSYGAKGEINTVSTCKDVTVWVTVRRLNASSWKLK